MHVSQYSISFVPHLSSATALVPMTVPRIRTMVLISLCHFHCLMSLSVVHSALLSLSMLLDS